MQRTRLIRVTPLRLAAQTLKVFAMIAAAWYTGLLIGGILAGAGLSLNGAAYISTYIAVPIALSAALQWVFGGHRSLKAGVVLAVFSFFAGIFFVGLIDAMLWGA